MTTTPPRPDRDTAGVEAVEPPCVVPLADESATLELVGGKGTSLARLARAGLPVPAGFHVTTAAYDLFVARSGLEALIMAAVAGVDLAVPATAEAAAQTIAALFARHPLPSEVADGVEAAYRRLGDEDPAVAVRSSATAEDLPELSFAGQQDSYLNVRGAPQLLAAVQRCWASLWTARAISYRARNGIAADSVRLAVVVQTLVAADAAGILFTADPVTGRTDQTVINAAWGLGEAIVGGQVTPDTIVVEPDQGRVRSAEIADKAVMTVPTTDGTATVPVPPERRRAAVLTDAQAIALARLGSEIAALYGQPMDVEWVRTSEELAIVQARPITTLQQRSAPVDAWNDSLAMDCLWTRGNIGEAIPDVVTPCSRSLLNIVFDDMMPTLYLGGYAPVGYIGGRPYMNLSVLMTMVGAIGMSRARLFAATGDLFGRVPDDVAIPRLPIGRWTIIRTVLPATVRNRRRIRANGPRLAAFLATAPARCAALLEQATTAATAAELTALWQNGLLPYLHECNYMLEAGSKRDGGAFIRIRNTLRKLVGETDTNALLLTTGAGPDQLASLGPVQGLLQLAQGQIDRATFAREYGHHSAHLFEISYPRPAEDPEWIERQLAGLRDAPTDIAVLLDRQKAAQEAAWERFRRRYPRRAAKLRSAIAQAQTAAHEREAARSEQARAFWPLRAFVLRAGELTGEGDRLFFLTLDEILRLLTGDTTPLAQIPARQAIYADYAALPPYPAIIRGRFDPFAWAASPARRSDIFDATQPTAAPSATVRGFPGAPGIVEGRARVVLSVEAGEQLQPGEILVTTLTNIGWTPLFPRAVAVVTDVGAPLSHAAIVARELGIPAVVGCGNATMQLQTGDLLRVDGARGAVDVLDRAVPA